MDPTLTLEGGQAETGCIFRGAGPAAGELRPGGHGIARGATASPGAGRAGAPGPGYASAGGASPRPGIAPGQTPPECRPSRRPSDGGEVPPLAGRELAALNAAGRIETHSAAACLVYALRLLNS